MNRQSLTFPSEFLWGTATSAHQVEGNNLHSDWWAYEQVPGHIQRGDKSGLACDHWRRFAADFDLCRAMRNNAVRLSFEWARIEPREGQIDDTAVRHYHEVLDALAQRNLTPFVTVHHFTLPLWFAHRGGFAVKDNLRHFERYCGLLAGEFGSRVRFWNTINEPSIYAMMSYLFGYFAPGEKSPRLFRLVMQNILAAHAVAYHALKRAHPENQIGLVKNIPYYTPFNPRHPLDKLAAAQHDWLYNAFVIEGIRTGRRHLPLGDGKVLPGLAGSVDFWGLNYYNQSRCKWYWPLATINAGERHRMTQTAWAPYPPGLKQNLLRLASFGLPLYVTENGLATDDDPWRCAYLIEHLRQVHEAIAAGADVRGYFYWSLLDNFEWEDGWFPKFGLIGCDPQTRERRPKPSAELYGQIAAANALQAEWFEEYPWDMETMDLARRRTIAPAG
ncbi:MAG: glycoside hydrolase family 1 protein [Myxococcales bacterium]|nr:glycoside hydrolase family 1 protein [Myxococcales bacterium]